MKNFIAVLITALFISSCAVTQNSEEVRPRILQNFTDTSDLAHVNGAVFYTTKDSSLVYSRHKSFQNVSSQISTLTTQLNTKLPIAGGNMVGNLGVQSGAANKVLIAMNLGGNSSNGNSTFGPAAYYLGFGHREWGVGTYRLIGFGFRYTVNDHYPAVIGYQETSGSSSTFGELIFATRNTTSNSAPTVRMRIQAGGNIKAYGPVTDPQDLTTKGYVDTLAWAVKVVTPTATYPVQGTPSHTLISNNANSAQTFNMPTARNGATYIFQKIGASVMTITGAIMDAGKNGSKVVSGAETNSTITFVCVGSSWLIVSKTGTWTTQ